MELKVSHVYILGVSLRKSEIVEMQHRRKDESVVVVVGGNEMRCYVIRSGTQALPREALDPSPLTLCHRLLRRDARV